MCSAEKLGPQSGGLLLPHHRQMLEESAIAPEVIAARGYRSVTKKVDLASIGFVGKQIRVPALLIPIYGPDGKIQLYQSRPDTPRIIDGKPVKYEFPKGAHMGLDVPPGARPLLITRIDRFTLPKA